jgi:hypothetical protein
MAEIEQPSNKNDRGNDTTGEFRDTASCDACDGNE